MLRSIAASGAARLPCARLVPAFVVTAVALALAGCAGGAGGLNLAQSPNSTATERSNEPKSELQKAAEYWGKQYQQNPRDPQAALNYARNLRALGAEQHAMAVLQAAHNLNPTHRQLSSEFGRLALQQNQLGAAEKLLAHADDPVNGDWRTVSARGTVLAKQGKHREAISLFERARRMAPQQSSVLNNLALSYAMDGQAQKAEGMLRDALAKAPDDQRIAQNLSLVLGLQGKHDEAKAILARVLPPEKAAEDVAVLREMVPAQQAAARPVTAAPPSTARFRPAPGKSMAAVADDATSMVPALADRHGVAANSQPVSLAPRR